MKNYYEILGVERSATQDEIKKVYRKLSIKFHPDKNPDDNFFEDRFKEINEAYSILSDEGKRTEYNEEYDSFIKLHSNFRQAEEYLRNEAEKIKSEKEKLKEEYEDLRNKQNQATSKNIQRDVEVEQLIEEKGNNDFGLYFSILGFFGIIAITLIVALLPKQEESNFTENIETISVDSSATVVDSATTAVDSVAKYVDDSDMAFLDSVSRTWKKDNAVSSNELPKNEFYFTIGSTKDEVLKAQGTPKRVQEFYNREKWYYGNYELASITFDTYGNVKEYDNDDNILNVKLKVQKKVIEEQQSYSSYKSNSNETKEYPSGYYQLPEGGIIRDENDAELIRVPPNETIWVYNNNTFSKYVVGADYKGVHGRINKNYLK